jgi:vanillate O-demethylase ferredoxin subunit
MGLDLQVLVKHKAVEAEGICSFELVAIGGGPLPPYEPGAHIDVQTPGGLVRQYSLCGDCADGQSYRIAVLREANGRGGSQAMHDRVREGDVLSISPPRNLFALADDEAPILLLAGGIGITPILSMAIDLKRRGKAFQMHYFTRNRSRTAFRDLVGSADWASCAQLHHDDDASSQIDVREVLAAASSLAHVYVCGPAGFIDAVLGHARDMAWPEDRLHREYFAPVAVDTDGDSPFDVVIASTGRVIHIPANQSVLSTLTSAGIDVMASCEQGVCGTCLTRVLDGTPDHRDSYLTPDEQARGDQFTPCCSRARSPRLVLDL